MACGDPNSLLVDPMLFRKTNGLSKVSSDTVVMVEDLMEAQDPPNILAIGLRR